MKKQLSQQSLSYYVYVFLVVKTMIPLEQVP